MELQDEIIVKRALAILRVVVKRSAVSQREIAELIGSSLGTTNHILQQLIDGGIVEAEEITTTKGKRGFLYNLTAKGVREKVNLTKNYLSSRRLVAETLAAEIQLLEFELEKINS